MNTVRISAVSYLNTLPLIYGIQRSGILRDYKLNLEVPSLCAKRLIEGSADISLVPTGALPMIPDYSIVGNHCIGADGDVKTVVLLSNRPVQELRSIYLDTDSYTSVNLVKILAKRLWMIQPEWLTLAAIDPALPADDSGVVLIGDKTFGITKQFRYCYDLAGCWKELTSLPFVFAVWIHRNPLPGAFIRFFEKALEWGVEHYRESILIAREPRIPEEELLDYFENYISYPLDEAKKTGMKLFLEWFEEDIGKR